jgi:hypothetical protein
MLALERAVGASRVRAIECIAGGGAHHWIVTMYGYFFWRVAKTGLAAAPAASTWKKVALGPPPSLCCVG